LKDLLKTIGDIGIIPVIKVSDVNKAADLAGALKNGGIPVAEVTFRAAGADKAIASMRAAHPDMIVGAGTVLTVAQAELAVEAGAQFLVSPGFNPKVVGWCAARGIPITPGCVTPTEIEQALEFGLDTVKFFPAEQCGGLERIKALAAPYGGVKFIPTGGITPDNLPAYLAFDRVIACGGSFMVKEEFIEKGEWDKITALSQQAVNRVLGFSLAHIGIGTGSAEEAKFLAGALAGVWPQEIRELPGQLGPAAFFLGSAIEVLASPGRGSKGHIAIGTASVTRAMAHLKRRGIALDEATLQLTPTGKPRLIFLAGEYGGFGVHLVQA
jgi:2-dehydro-3-deoxyphosphogluconate aldolase/(4S)-4-hydroxy-2-oxoglutarate aldolase